MQHINASQPVLHLGGFSSCLSSLLVPIMTLFTLLFLGAGQFGLYAVMHYSETGLDRVTTIKSGSLKNWAREVTKITHQLHTI